MPGQDCESTFVKRHKVDVDQVSNASTDVLNTACADANTTIRSASLWNRYSSDHDHSWDRSNMEPFKLSDLTHNLKWKGLLRLEHRVMGDEDRILLFSSDRAGAMGKIIFSFITVNNSICSKDDNSSKEVRVVDRESSSYYTMDELQNMVQAKIINLEIKEQYRGSDLGGLLFSLATTILRLRYQQTIRCSLDAEEDVQRHNRLVTFYKNLGCEVKVNAKVTYIGSTNGDQVIRKIPMQIVLQPMVIDDREDLPSCLHSSIHDIYRFTPVQFLAQPHYSMHPVNVQVLDHSMTQPSRPIYWLLSERQDGRIQLQTTLGMVVTIDHDGTLRLQPKELARPLDGSFFVLERWFDNMESKSDHVENSSMMDCVTNSFHSEPTLKVQNSVWDDLWTIRSVKHNVFLSTSCLNGSSRSTPSRETTLCCNKEPVFWTIQARPNAGGITWICTKETPPHRFHYRQYWSIQSMQYVNCMKTRFIEPYSTNPRLTIYEALAATRNIPLKPFRKRRAPAIAEISVRTMCFAMAEAARAEDFPDWIQVIALIHELGRVASLFSDEIKEGRSLDWTISCAARVVGIHPPNHCSFSTFRHLDPDTQRYNDVHPIYRRHCGLRNTHLTWTGPEYLYHILQLNNTRLCDEALSVLRLFPLRCWHAYKSEYTDILADDDEFIKPTVNEFDRLRRRVKRILYDNEESMEGLFSDATCEKLWEDYYSSLLGKYNCVGLIQW
jgi:hypothetical protein